MDANTLYQTAVTALMAAAWKVAGAFVIWLVGRWLIAFATRTLGATLSRQRLDRSLDTSRPASHSSSTLRCS